MLLFRYALCLPVETMNNPVNPKAFVSVVIPALNEEEPIADVVRSIPREIASEVIVVDNGSHDRTAERAREAGARIISEPRRGYGRACRAGVEAVAAECDIIVFLDGDGKAWNHESTRNNTK